MPKYTQDGRLMALETPLGKDALLLEGLHGVEGISELFRFELDLLAPPGPIAFDKLLGQSATIQLISKEGTRYVNGIVSRFSRGGEIRGPDGDVTFVRHRAEIVPKFWLLDLQARSRIFQQLSVPDILNQVLSNLTVKYQFQGKYEKRDYCTQYRETDFEFASRLMEEEGIYYFFTHEDGKHTMVVADTPQSHPENPLSAKLLYEVVHGGTRPENRVFAWLKNQELTSGKVTLWDSCFEKSGSNFEAKQTITESVKVGTVEHKLKTGGNDSLEIYDYPGLFAQRFDGIDPSGGDRAADIAKISQDNQRTAKIYMEQEASEAIWIECESTCMQLTSGHTFTLDRHPDADGKYVLTRVHHEGSLEGAYTHGTADTGTYVNRFECVPFDLPFRPESRIERPTIHGTQTAVVVGAKGEEISTDKYGRVKVQFAWDRDGKQDLNSACWVRVATNWAGQQWGAISIPRIGQEVVVAYEEGDPDRPIIVGSVYNDAQMPPYKLPDNKTQSGIKSRSTLKATAENFNELRFEDKKDSEEIYFHAEKDFNRVVENNDTLKVGFDKKDNGDRTVEIYNNHTVTIGAGRGKAADGSETLSVYNNRTATIETGNESLQIKMGDQSTVLDQGNQSTQLKMGNQTTKLDMGNQSITLSMGNQTTKLNLGQSSTEAMQSIELKVGMNSIKIDQMGVTIKGMMISIEGDVQTEVKGLMTTVSGDAILQAKGGITMIG